METSLLRNAHELPAMYSTCRVMFKDREKKDLLWGKLSPEIGVVGKYGTVISSVNMLCKSTFYPKLNNKAVCMVSYRQTLYFIHFSPGA